MTVPDSLPTDADALRALLLAERARHGEERERWMAIIAELQRHRHHVDRRVGIDDALLRPGAAVGGGGVDVEAGRQHVRHRHRVGVGRPVVDRADPVADDAEALVKEKEAQEAGNCGPAST